MKTRTLLATLGLIAVLGLSPGCDNPDAGRPPGLVAVVDVVRLQQETGFFDVRNAELKKIQQTWETQINSMQESFQNQLQAAAKDISKPPTPEQMAKFDTLRTRMGQMIEDAYGSFQNAIQQREQELQVQFRQKYHDVIVQAATEKGLSVVMESGPWIAAAAQDCDVTDSALAKIKSAGNTFTADAVAPGKPGASGASGAGPTAPGVGIPGGFPGMAPGAPSGFSGRSFEPGTPPGMAPGMVPGMAPGVAPANPTNPPKPAGESAQTQPAAQP